ncbi:MAG: zinc-ribbon domain-containing protein [Candidatus Woesearchaeota archaeon]
MKQKAEEPLQEDFELCPYCGAENKPSATKCKKCGEEIVDGDQELY